MLYSYTLNNNNEKNSIKLNFNIPQYNNYINQKGLLSPFYTTTYYSLQQQNSVVYRK